MRLLAVGGGSGGHVTPVLAVINQLNSLSPADELVVHFVCDHAFSSQAQGLMKQAVVDVQVSVIMAGKYRRYHGHSWLQKLLDFRTNIYNIRDVFFIGIGVLQALWKIFRFKPDVVFAKGGYVCLPVGAAAKLLGIPIIIHDSDTRPGLTNRILGRWAAAIATGAPLEYYSYDESISTYTGVPIDARYQPISDQRKLELKASLQLDQSRPLVVVTGGGLGSVAINTATSKAAQRLIQAGYSIYHVTGKKHFDRVNETTAKSQHYIITPFVYGNMPDILAAADVVVSRASATFLQELAGLKKPVIAIPAKHLSDQQKNAEVFGSADAALVLQDDDIARGDIYFDSIDHLLSDKEAADKLAESLHQFAKPEAATDVARIIENVYARQKGGAE